MFCQPKPESISAWRLCQPFHTGIQYEIQASALDGLARSYALTLVTMSTVSSCCAIKSSLFNDYSKRLVTVAHVSTV